MGIRTYQECRSRDGWQPVEVQSSSDPDKRYLVHVNPWDFPEENICECQGYHFRGQCRHQQEATDRLCGWKEGDDPSQQGTDRDDMICPRCKGSTIWRIEVDG